MEDTRVELLAMIETLLENKDYRELKRTLEDIYPIDIAEMFDDLSANECVILFRLLSKDAAAEVFSYLEGQRRRDIVSAIHENLLGYILDELYFDDKIDFLEEMPANFVKTLLANSTQEERKLINQFLSFPENSAGSLMTIEFVDLKKHLTVRQALERIKVTGVDKETIYTCYVLDDKRRLEGLVSLRKLVLSDEGAVVGDIMHADLIKVDATEDQEEVADLFKRYDLTTLPVVDAEQRLVGIITIDDVIDVIEQENTEDFQKMAAMAPSDEKYLDSGVWSLAKKRIMWLLILMISATFTGGIISRYEELLSTAVMLTAFIPMLMDSGGNSGSQSSTLVIRGIALGEIELRDWPMVLWKEFRVSAIVGAMLGIVNFGRMLLFTSSGLQVALVVSVTLLLTVMIAKVVGGILPVAAKALRLDPAIMAGPLITTIVDAFALVIYFTVAMGILQL